MTVSSRGRRTLRVRDPFRRTGYMTWGPFSSSESQQLQVNREKSAVAQPRAELIDRVTPLQKKFFALAERHLDSANHVVRNLATAVFAHREKFFTFIDHEGVEPTNNRAERAMRTAVQRRKIMFGNRSDVGEIAVARLLTRHANLPDATPQCARVSDRSDPLPPSWSIRRLAASKTAIAP